MNPKLLILPQALAVIALGLSAGWYLGLSNEVVPALNQLDAATYIQVQQKLDQSTQNWGYTALFFAATLMPFIAAGLAAFKSQRRTALFWLLVALLHFLGVYWVSIVTNLPIQQDMMQWSATAPPADWQSLRATWATGNSIRTIAEIICFISALILIIRRDTIANSTFARHSHRQ